MRKKPGYREITFMLTDEQYALLERYWRYHTKEQYITNAVISLLLEALEKRMQTDESENR